MTTMILLIVGLALILVAVVWAIRGDKGEAAVGDRVDARLNRYVNARTTPTVAAAGGDRALDQVRTALFQLVGQRLETASVREALPDALARADIPLLPSEWIMVVVGISAVTAIGFTVLFGNFLLGLPAGVWAGYGGTRFYLGMRQRRRANRITKQLSPVVQMLASTVRAGNTFVQAIAIAAKSTNDPIRGELTRFVAMTQMGQSQEQALSLLVQRNPSEHVKFLAAAVIVTNETGGNIADVLDLIAENVQEQIKMAAQVKALTAQAKISGYVVTGAPIALIGLLSMVSGSYFRPMFTDSLGQKILVSAGVMMLIGWAIIRKITSIAL